VRFFLAKKSELTLAVGMTLIFTVMMMIVMPLFVKAIGMDELISGARGWAAR
jgi:uncharacterized membrane protein YadS